MSEATVAIHMPEPLYQRLQRLAALTKRPLESLVLQALDANIPPLLEEMPEHVRADLAALETLDDAALRQIAHGSWSAEQNARYTALLEKERAGTLTPTEQETLEGLYHEANSHMLRKAYANALLKWRGHRLPTLAQLHATA
jgi:predicted DNA-binding protein